MYVCVCVCVREVCMFVCSLACACNKLICTSLSYISQIQIIVYLLLVLHIHDIVRFSLYQVVGPTAQ